MRYLIWFLRAVLFLLLLGFVVKNDQPVVLHFYFGYQWESSLVVILLCFFTLGAAVGLLAMLGTLLRLRRELSAHKREQKLRHTLAKIDEAQQPVQPS